jgi:hypothetical protein
MARKVVSRHLGGAVGNGGVGARDRAGKDEHNYENEVERTHARRLARARPKVKSFTIDPCVACSLLY